MSNPISNPVRHPRQHPAAIHLATHSLDANPTDAQPKTLALGVQACTRQAFSHSRHVSPPAAQRPISTRLHWTRSHWRAADRSLQSKPYSRYSARTELDEASSCRTITHAAFDQKVIFQTNSYGGTASVPYSAAWLSQISQNKRTARWRMQYLSREDIVDQIYALQKRYRAQELAFRPKAVAFKTWFQPTFKTFDISLGQEKIIKMSSFNDKSAKALASFLCEQGASYIMVIRRPMGDDYTVAFHQSGYAVHLFDPNHGEYRFRCTELSEGLQSLIAAHSQQISVPEIRLIKVQLH